MTAEWFLAALRHDRAVVLGSLALVILVAWVYLLRGAGVEMETMDMGDGQIMLMLPEWSLGYGLVLRRRILRLATAIERREPAAG